MWTGQKRLCGEMLKSYSKRFVLFSQMQNAAIAEIHPDDVSFLQDRVTSQLGPEPKSCCTKHMQLVVYYGKCTRV